MIFVVVFLVAAFSFDCPEQKQTRKRVGITGMKAPARGGTEIYDASGKSVVGKVKKNIVDEKICFYFVDDKSAEFVGKESDGKALFNQDTVRAREKFPFFAAGEKSTVKILSAGRVVV